MWSSNMFTGPTRLTCTDSALDITTEIERDPAAVEALRRGLDQLDRGEGRWLPEGETGDED